MSPKFLGRIGIRVADMIATDGGKFANGYYFRKLITVALKSSDELSGLLDHELIHALRDMGLFTDGEWRILEAEARRKWLNDPEIARRVSGYDRLSDAQKLEEAIAFAAQRGPAIQASTFAARMLNRVRDFFRALGTAFKGNGFATPESIFRDIREGGFGKRLSAREGEGGPKFAQQPEEEPGADDARGKPLPQTVMPGMERSAKQAQAARETETGKIVPKAPQKAAGGLFAEPNNGLFGSNRPRVALRVVAMW